MSDQASRNERSIDDLQVHRASPEYQLPQNKRFCTNSISNQRSKYEVEEPGQILGDRHVNFQSSVSRVFSLLVKKEAISDSVFTSVRIITMFTTATVNEHRWYYHSDFYQGVAGFWKISPLYRISLRKNDCIFLFFGIEYDISFFIYFQKYKFKKVIISFEKWKFLRKFKIYFQYLIFLQEKILFLNYLNPYWTAPLYILYKFYQQKYAAQGTGNQKLNLRFAISTNRRGGSRRWSRSCLYDQINSSKSRQTKSWPFL